MVNRKRQKQNLSYEEDDLHTRKRDFLYKALVDFTNCTDLNVSIIQLLKGARIIAISFVPCTSKAGNVYADSSIVASTVRRAYMSKHVKLGGDANAKNVENHLELFEEISKEFWELKILSPRFGF
jgi:hypothetical protein